MIRFLILLLLPSIALAGDTLYLRDTTGNATPEFYLDLELARGASAVTITKGTNGNTFFFEGFTSLPLISPGQITAGQQITCNLRGLEALSTTNYGFECVLMYVRNNVWTGIETTNCSAELGTTQAAFPLTMTPASTTTLQVGDRIHISVWACEIGGAGASGSTVSLFVNGPTPAASGDSWITLFDDLTFEGETPLCTDHSNMGFWGCF